MGKHILVSLCPAYVEYYSQIAEKYLTQNKISLSVEEMEPGEFGIQVTKADGKKSWFRADVGDQSPVLTWEDAGKAEQSVTEYALPNVGYRVMKYRIQNFYRLLARYETVA
jgi:hypothetical protein